MIVLQFICKKKKKAVLYICRTGQTWPFGVKKSNTKRFVFIEKMHILQLVTTSDNCWQTY